MTHEWANKIGADGYSDDAIGAVASGERPAGLRGDDLMKLRTQVLSQEEMELVHKRTLELLKTSASASRANGALKVLAKHGAEVDFKTQDRQDFRDPAPEMPANSPEEAMCWAPGIRDSISPCLL